MTNGSDKAPNIVGIGASAGGLEATSQLITHLSPDMPCAFVVLQHLSPSHRSMMVEILGRETSLQVREAGQGDVPRSGVIYVVPSNFNALIKDGHLQLEMAPPEVVPKPSINQFFISLAAEEGDRAIGVVLSGTGSDGVAGLRAIQAAGGFTLAQQPETAKYDGMPRSAIEAGVVDHVLPPAKVADKLKELLEIPARAEEDGSDGLIFPLLDRLKEKLHFDFSGYKTGTLMRRIHRRIVATGNHDLPGYLAWLQENESELDRLARDILISVTAFFRDSDAFEVLRRAVERICDRHAPSNEIRVWVAGCASGEEAYTIAILFAETLGERLPEYRVQIFATDVDEDALNIARRGVYPAAALSEMDENLLERYFRPVNNAYEVGKVLRDMIVFARHNLVSDPPFLRLDLVSCRNVLIYFDATLQAKVLQMFHFGLIKEGCLFLGRSESITHAEQLFAPVERRERLYRKQGDTPVSPITEVSPLRTPAQRRDRRIETLLSGLVAHYGFTAVLCDIQGNIQHSVGEVERFLQFPAGASRLSVSDVVVAPLRGELLTLLHRRNQTGKAQSGRRRKLDRKWVRVFVEPVHEVGTPLTLVVFVPERAEKQVVPEGKVPAGDTTLELENELLVTREHLQTMIEEMATSNEEMQALNEEAQAANEELQATNEELEAANEELQASNEELLTLNSELNAKTGEVFRLNEEYSHLYDALEFPIMVFDQSGHLTRFNAAAALRFELRPTAIHKHIDSLRMPAALGHLGTLLGRVLSHGERVTETLGLFDRVLTLTIFPGADKHGNVVNLVVSLVDVTEIAQTQAQLLESEAKLSSLMERTTVIFAMKDLSGRYLYANRRFLEYFDLVEGAYLGQTDFTLLPRDLAADLWAEDLQALRKGELVESEHRFEHKGEHRYLRATHQVMWNKSGDPSAFIIEAEDVTLKHFAEEQMRITARVFDQTGEGILVTDPKGVIQTVNAAFSRISGYVPAEAIGQTPALLKSGRQSDEFYHVMWQRLQEHGSWQGEIWNRRKNGEVYPEWLTINRVDDEHGKPEHYVAVFSDISSIKSAQRKAEFLSTHDTLTGMANRSLFYDRLRQALSQARRNRTQAALLFIDLDNFKTINDTLGHDIGDHLLKQVSQRLQDIVRDVDTVARLGGDEFTAVLVDCDFATAERVSRRIGEELATSFEVDEQRLFVSASIGVAFYPEDGDDSASLVKAADSAMYRAKEQGRNRVEFFHQELHVKLLRQATMQRALRLGLDKGHFHLVYQPKYCLGDGQALCGAEALLRWEDPTLGKVSPAEFIPVAESGGLITELSRLVEDLALDQIAEWRSRGLQVPPVALNVSPRSIREAGYAEALLSKLEARGLSPRQLQLEITEHTLMEVLTTVEQNLNELARKGLRFAIDDFGTGYSSLSYLKRLPISELKIDKTFVDGLGRDKEDEAIAKAVLSLGEALNLECVAEGVETESQLEWLRAQGCQVAQGFLLSRPLLPDAFEAQLVQNKTGGT